MPALLNTPEPLEEKEECQVCLHGNLEQLSLLDHFSNYNRLKRVTAWMLRFIHNCSSRGEPKITSDTLATSELLTAEQHWLHRVQQLKFEKEIASLRKGTPFPRSSKLLPLHPILDDQGVLRVGGRMRNSKLRFEKCHYSTPRRPRTEQVNKL